MIKSDVKKNLQAAFTAVCIALLCLVAAGCSSTKVERLDPETTVDLSGYWNDTDVRLVADTLIKECTAANAIVANAKSSKNGRANKPLNGLQTKPVRILCL